MTKELNEESGGRCTKIFLIDLEPTLRRKKITNSALSVIVCLVEIMVRCDLYMIPKPPPRESLRKVKKE